MVNTEIVPLWQIDTVFPYITEGLQRACDNTGGDINAAYLFQQCRSSEAILVVASVETVITGALVLRFENWSGKSVLRVLALWCNGKGAWAALDTKAHEIKRQYGAKSIISEGREGWKRRYPHAKILRILYEVE